MIRQFSNPSEFFKAWKFYFKRDFVLLPETKNSDGHKMFIYEKYKRKH